MKSRYTSIIIVAAFLCISAVAFNLVAFADADTEEPETSDATIDTEQDKVSYAIGAQIGHSVLQGDVDINTDVLIHGIADVLEEKELAMSDTEMQETMIALQQRMQQQQLEQMTPEQREQLQQQMQQQQQMEQLTPEQREQLQRQMQQQMQ